MASVSSLFFYPGSPTAFSFFSPETFVGDWSLERFEAAGHEWLLDRTIHRISLILHSPRDA
ncbi:hypothetical protein K1719_046056 [Acacia pycnantha]|nr:hypothetical protein K1719_046056 [Acacia pycnantha]